MKLVDATIAYEDKYPLTALRYNQDNNVYPIVTKKKYKLK